MKITDKQIREHIGHGYGNRRVKIKRGGEIHYYGATDHYDRAHDYWHYWGTREEANREILQFNRREGHENKRNMGKHKNTKT